MTTPSPLFGLRVLDLADETGFLCGKLLADLGADVIKVEQPGGDFSRNIGPFYHDQPDPERSLYWFGHNVNKRGITLDITTADGRALFKRLVAKSDFLVETFRPGYLAELGLDYAVLRQINPRLILISITPFGQTGPYCDYVSTDLVQMAIGGFSYMGGDPDRAPLRISFDQSSILGASQAAAVAMIANYNRQLTGEGQHIDVSIQATVATNISSAIPFFLTANSSRKRQGGALEGMRAVRQRSIWACKDGHLIWALFGGRRGEREQGPLVKWMDEEGQADDFLRTYKWSEYDIYKSSQPLQDKLEDYFARFFLTHTKAELLEKGVKRGMMTYPVSSPKDMAANPQLAARGVWSQLEHPELGEKLTYPAQWFKADKFSTSLRHRAPLIGEHNTAIYSELGLSPADLTRLKEAGVI